MNAISETLERLEAEPLQSSSAHAKARLARLIEYPDLGRLGQNRLFAGIPAELVSDIGASVDLLRFDADDVVFDEGDRGDCLYLVVEGGVRISKTGRAGKQETLSYIQPGNFFGEMALIDGLPRSANAIAAEPTILGCISAQSFAHMLESAPSGVLMNFLRSIVERLRGIDSHFITEVMRTERLSLVGTMANSIIHDLKTPIQALVSCTSLIGARAHDPEIKQFIGMMEKANTMMMDMVQELLDFARGQSSLHLARHPAHALIEELDAQLFRLVPSNVHLFREIKCCEEINVDTGRLARVLLNLIKNSIESMPQGGVLFLAMKQENGKVVVRVSDTGCGIPAELQAKIFEPFVTHGKSKGTGLGMAIAKSVVEAHGGTITLKSVAGNGTTIEIALPVLDPAQ